MHGNVPASQVSERPVGLLLLHGLTGMPTEMRPMAKHFLKQGFQVKAPLLKGHGGSHQELLATSWQDWYETASQALDELSETCGRVYIAGLCMGALLAVLLAARKPEQVQGIISLSPTLNRFAKQSPWEDVLVSLLPLLYKMPFLFDRLYWEEKPPYGVQDPRLQRKIAESLKKNSENISEHGSFRMYLGSFHQLDRLIKITRQEAVHIQCPALVMHSLEDSVAPIANAIQLYFWLGSADKTLHLLTGCDHVMTIDWQRNVVNQWVEAFINQCHLKAGAAPSRMQGVPRHSIA